jgi:O-antigen ligase
MVIWVMPAAVSKISSLSKDLSWWHTLWFLMLLSGLVFRIRSTEVANASPLDPWALFRVGLIAVIGCSLLCHLSLPRESYWVKSLSNGLLGLLTAYTAACLLSTIWSAYPLWTLYKSGEYFIDIGLIAAILTTVHNERDFKSFFDWTWILLFFLIGTAWIGAIAWPDLAILQGVGLLGFSLRGVFPAFETNGVGELGSILASVGFTRFILSKQHRFLYLMVFFSGFITLLFSQSRSPLIGLLMAFTVILLLSKRTGLLCLLPVFTIAAFLLIVPLDTFADFFVRGQRDEDFESLSGRTNLWSVGWALLLEQPLVGYGAYAGTRFTGITDIMETANSSILNTWLEVALGIGIPGTLLVFFTLCGVWIILLKRAWLSQANTLVHLLTVEALGILAIISVRSIFTVQLVWHPPTTFLLVLGYAELVRRTCSRINYEDTARSQLLSPSGR